MKKRIKNGGDIIRKQRFTVSTFICPECGLEFPLPRLRAKQRECGHIKDLYCPRCRKVVKFEERKYNQFY